MSKKNATPEKWFTYHDKGPSSPIPGWKIKIKDDIRTPIALLPTMTQRAEVIQGRRARLIVQLANRHFKNKAAMAFGRAIVKATNARANRKS